MGRPSAISPDKFNTFGDLLKYLRRRAGLTQQELSIAVGYSDTQISRMEQNQRVPGQATLTAQFVPALHLEHEPEWVTRLLELARQAHRDDAPLPEASGSHLPPTPTHNLPSQLTSFVGRESEIAEIKRRVSAARLVTLAGPGGTGKTRLALQVAAEMPAKFPDGVWLVELAPVSNPALIPLILATALGVQEEPGRHLLVTLTSHLRAKQTWLVLDNCEHLIEACAQLAETLLRACPNLNILATSREPLGIAGETTFLVPSLSLPEARPGLTVEELSQYESIRLFVDRAAAAMPDFKLTIQNALTVAQVCLQLDGMPLAIELAAARVRMLTVEQIATRLQDRFRLLLGGSRTALPRHQTLSALIDWSYDLLSEPERSLLRRLSVFAGGWTLEAAEAVGVGERPGGANILDLLTQLVNKSLVVANREQGREARYRLPESIRQYAKEKLIECGEAASVRTCHLEFFLTWAEKAAPRLHGAEQAAWFARLEAEHDNLRAAWEWSRAPSGETGEAQGLLLAEALFWFWYIRNYMSEGRGWLQEALTHGAASQHTPARAKALYAAGALGYKQADYPRARREIEESITLFREAGPPGRQGLAYALIMLGELAEYHGDIGQSPSLFQEGVALFRELGDRSGWPCRCIRWVSPRTRHTRMRYRSAGQAQHPRCLMTRRRGARFTRKAWPYSENWGISGPRRCLWEAWGTWPSARAIVRRGGHYSRSAWQSNGSLATSSGWAGRCGR